MESKGFGAPGEDEVSLQKWPKAHSRNDDLIWFQRLVVLKGQKDSEARVDTRNINWAPFRFWLPSSFSLSLTFGNPDLLGWWARMIYWSKCFFNVLCNSAVVDNSRRVICSLSCWCAKQGCQENWSKFAKICWRDHFCCKSPWPRPEVPYFRKFVRTCTAFFTEQRRKKLIPKLILDFVLKKFAKFSQVLYSGCR